MVIRAAWKDDLNGTSAELLHGETIRLAGEFLNSPKDETVTPRLHFQQLQPETVKRHGERKTFIFQDLETQKMSFCVTMTSKIPLLCLMTSHRRL